MPDWLILAHPKVVHFPIALFIAALGFEILSLIFKKESLHKTALNTFVLAALLTPLVVRTGLWEVERLNLSHPLLDQHQQYALWTMWSSLMSLPVLWFFYHKYHKLFRVFFIICLLGTSVLVTMTADKGGHMVFEYGVGTEVF